MNYKGYEIRPHKQLPMTFEIGVGENKGSMPNILSGLYTSRTVAFQHIDDYLANKKPKETDAKEATEGRGK